MKYNHKIIKASIKAYLYGEWNKCDDDTIQMCNFRIYLQFIALFGICIGLGVHKTRNSCKLKTEQTLSIDTIVANVWSRLCRQNRHLWAHVCVNSTEHLNIVLHVWCYPMHGAIVHSFARSLSMHTSTHTVISLTCMRHFFHQYNYIYNAIIIFFPDTLSHTRPVQL